MVAGSGMFKCSYARRVAMRPRGVRSKKPIWRRYGSCTSSIVSIYSDVEAANVWIPTGPPLYFVIIVSKIRRSLNSRPF